MARRFDGRGRETGAFLMRSTFAPGGLTPFGCNSGSWTARASNERVGALSDSNTMGRQPMWVELDMDGKRPAAGNWARTERTAGWLLPGMVACFARFRGQTMEFEREKLLWKRSPTQHPERALLLGADNNDLV